MAASIGLAPPWVLALLGFFSAVYHNITMVHAEPTLPYDRPPLSKRVLASSWPPEKVLLRSPATLEKLALDWFQGVEATHLDVAGHRVALSNGKLLDFDVAVIATGLTPRSLAGGQELHGVFVLRTLEEALALRRALAAGRRLVVVSGGFLGLEAAATARQLGLEVDQWQFARLDEGRPVPDPTSLYLAASFAAGKLYTVVYTALGGNHTTLSDDGHAARGRGGRAPAARSKTDRGVLRQLPPAAGAPYPRVVPALDDDGNEVAGLRLPDVAAPLASYTGWNVRHPEIGAPDELLLRAGATLPFPRSAAERAATGDRRRSIEERYASREDYLGRGRAAATELVQARYLLEEDIAPILERAALRWDLFTGASEPGQAPSR